MCNHVLSEYLETTYTIGLLDLLTLPAQQAKTMNVQTVNYLYHMLYQQCGSVHAAHYVIEPEQVDYETANVLLYEQLPALKKRIADNIVLAVNVLGDAFRKDPSWIAKANNARTFDEYIRIVSRVRHRRQ